MNEALKLKRVAKGARPVFSQDPEIDRVMAVTMALASEVAVLRERIDTISTIASNKNVLSLDEIENFRPSKEHEERREQWREEFLERILYIMQVQADHAAP